MKAKLIARNVDMEKLSTHEICALHLSAFLNVASQEYAHCGTGMLISYDTDLLQDSFLVTQVLPHFGIKDEIDANPTMVSDKVDTLLSLKSNQQGGTHTSYQQ
jgi:hypothetical protein